MPMDLARHEEILNQLNDKDLTHQERGDLLTELRSDYSQVIKDDTDFKSRTKELEDENKDLLLTNSKFFRMQGIEGNPDLEKEQEKKTASETVTIKDFEKTVKE